MTKRIILLVLCLSVCLAVLTGCGCKHETWNRATCLEPKTCAECGETEGEPRGHDWNDADCVNPKTCDDCGETEGDPLGHDWVDATCTAPKTCSVCGETEGEVLEHVMGEWTEIDLETEERSCANCDYTEQQTIDRMAQFLAYMQGTWETAYVYMDETVYYPEDFTDPSVVESYFYFNEDGSIQLYINGSTYDVVIMEEYGMDFSVEEDYNMYTCIMTEGVDVYTAILFVEHDGSLDLWFSVGDVFWIYEPSV